MAVKVQLLRSSTADKRPLAASLLDGELALNTASGTSGAFFEDAGGNIIKLGPAEVGSTAPNASPAAGGSSGNTTGEFWYDTANAGGNSLPVLRIHNGSGFVSAGSITLGSTSLAIGDAAVTTLAGLTSLTSASLVATTGAVLENQAYLELREQSGNGTNYVRLIAPDAIATNVTFKLPDGDGTADQVLKTDGSGNLGWAAPVGGQIETQAATADSTHFLTFVTDNNPNGSPAAETVYTQANINYNPSTEALTLGGTLNLPDSGLVLNSTAVDATAAELNILDGATLSTVELNYVDGVTSGIQAQIDGKQASATDLTTLSSMQSGAAAALALLTSGEIETLDGLTATTTQLNYVDATSSIQTQIDGKQDSATDLTTLSSMQTGAATQLAALTSAELAILDGATLSTTELNYVDGVTSSIQTQLDAKQASITAGDGIQNISNTLSVDLKNDSATAVTLTGLTESLFNVTLTKATNPGRLSFNDFVYNTGTTAYFYGSENTSGEGYVEISNSSDSRFDGAYVRYNGFKLDTGTVASGSAAFAADTTYDYFHQVEDYAILMLYSVEDAAWVMVDRNGYGTITDGSTLGLTSPNATEVTDWTGGTSGNSKNQPAASESDINYTGGWPLLILNTWWYVWFAPTDPSTWSGTVANLGYHLSSDGAAQEFVDSTIEGYQTSTGVYGPGTDDSNVSGYTGGGTESSYLEFTSGELQVRALDEDNMSSDSDTHVPTQQSTKAYVDNTVANYSLTTAVVLRDGSQAFTADQDMGSNKLTGLAEPTLNADAATKNYVDDATSGAGAFWTPIDVMADSDITLSGEQTIDGVLTSASRVLVMGQTTGSENGIYVSAAGAWSRATDADASDEFKKNKTVFVLLGSTYSGYVEAYTGADDPTLGTDTITFTNKQQAADIADGSITTAKLAADAVTNAKLADNAVDTENIAADAITATEIDDLAVGTAALADGAVTDAKVTDVATTKLTGNMPDARIVSSNVTQHAGDINLADLGTKSIDNLSDVDITTSAPTDGQVLVWNNGNGEFEPGDQPTQASLGVDHLITLSGVAEGSDDLGTFTGSIIADNETVKGALQDLEDYLEAQPPVTVEVSNNTGGTLTKGQAVYISGTNGGGVMEVSLADNDGSGTMPAIGLIFADILDGNSGQVIIGGELEGLQTGSYTAGDALYVDATAGALTTTRPSGDTVGVQKIGIVTRANAGAGRILIIGAGRTNDVNNEITALTGVARLAVNLGTFDGSTIADNETIKGALQDLEDGIEGISVNSISQGDSSVTVTDTGVDGNIAFATDGSTHWNINNSGHFIPAADSTYDIGVATTGHVANVHADNLYGTLQTASQLNITGVGTLTAGTWNADIVGSLYGGTGLDGSAAANGTLLIGTGSGYSLATLTGGQSISVTNASGSITLDADVANSASSSIAGNAGVASFNNSYFSVDGNGYVAPLTTFGINTVSSDSGSATPSSHSLTFTGADGITVSATGSTITVDLDDTAVTAASYGAADTVSTFTVDAQGRLTAAADVAISILHTAISDFDAGVQANRLDQMAAPTADVALNSQKITGLADPTNDQDAATKIYVDEVAQGLSVKTSVELATAAALPAVTYNNGTSGVGATLTADAVGALSIDGSTPDQNDRVLVKDQVLAEHNGIYTVTTVGDGSNAFVLTRATDQDEADEFAGAFVFVNEGSANADSGFVCTTDNPVTVGTTDINWTQFSGAGQITAGDGLTKSGNTLNAVGTADRISVSADAIDIASTYVGQTSITTLGTITTGSWNGSVLGLAYGGTGVSNTNIAESYAFIGPSSGSGNATFREIQTADIAPVSGGSFDAGTF